MAEKALDLTELTARLGRLKEKQDEVAAYKRKLDAAIAEAKSNLETAMTVAGTMTIKTLDGHYQATIAAKPGVKWDDSKKKELLEWIEANMPDPEIYLSVNKVAFTPVVKEARKKKVNVPGVELTVDKYLTFKVNKPKEAVEDTPAAEQE